MTGVTIIQTTQQVLPGTEFNEETFQVATPAALSNSEVELFYIATHDNNIVGVISDSTNNKNIVAGLVGNWVAAGRVVTQINRKELLKRLRIIPVVAPSVAAKVENEVAASAPEMTQSGDLLSTPATQSAIHKEEISDKEVASTPPPYPVHNPLKEVQQETVAAPSTNHIRTEDLKVEVVDTPVVQTTFHPDMPYVAPVVRESPAYTPAQSPAFAEEEPDFN